jgi:5'/3'-nucleotidase SurE
MGTTALAIVFGAMIQLWGMKKARILITSDDGYDAVGVRLLVRYLQSKYELKIAGSKDQMSGVGGKITSEGGSFELTELAGVEAVVVDGTPVDAVEVASSLWGSTFDWIVSGINWGANIGAALISSGTFSAAFRGLGMRVAKKGIAISWMVDPRYYSYGRYDDTRHLEDELWQYPGKKAGEMVDLAINQDNWGANLVNINLPRLETESFVMTHTLNDFHSYYKPAELDMSKKLFSFPYGSADQKIDRGSDVATLMDGKISITPCVDRFDDESLFKKLVGKSNNG